MEKCSTLLCGLHHIRGDFRRGAVKLEVAITLFNTFKNSSSICTEKLCYKELEANSEVRSISVKNVNHLQIELDIDYSSGAPLSAAKKTTNRIVVCKTYVLAIQGV